MTTVIFFWIIAITSAVITQTNSPIKVRIRLMGLRGFIFIIVGVKTGSSWFPLLIFLLFVGGILIIFIILSSIIPNENLKPVNYGILAAIIGSLEFARINHPNLNRNLSKGLVALVGESRIILFILSLITLYFFSMILIIKREQIPIRNVTCQR